MTQGLERLTEVAGDPRGFIGQWRAAHPGGRVIGLLPMNFPRELALAAGALPVVVQDDELPVSEGRGVLPEFYCGYTRNLADQAMTGRFDLYDGVLMADHCIQLVGAADVIRTMVPDTTVFFGMLNPSMHDTWASERVLAQMHEFLAELVRLGCRSPSQSDLVDAIASHNADRALIRSLYDDRAAGQGVFSPRELRAIVASAMVMPPDEHRRELTTAVADRDGSTRPVDDRVRVHLSGHLCHPPRAELLDEIEDCGVRVVDDDLFHGRRHVSTDVHVVPGADPVQAVARWYSERNVTIPCPTRVQRDVDWDTWLLDAVAANGAEAVIHLVPKFCEPHMLYYPELRKTLDAAGVPQLQIETEHEGIPLEALRTRVEAMVERTRRNRATTATTTEGAPA